MMKEHVMRLKDAPFSMIECGQKTIELRLWDEKRQQIRVGDCIRFLHANEETRMLICAVVALHRFSTFEELYKALPLRSCGYTEEELSTAHSEDMELYYSKEEQARYGVVGIEIALIN